MKNPPPSSFSEAEIGSKVAIGPRVKRGRSSGQVPSLTSAYRLANEPVAYRLMCSSVRFVFPDISCLTNFIKTQMRHSIGQQPETKSAYGPARQPLVNRSSNACQRLAVFLGSVYIIGHALHDKASQERQGVVSQVSSQKRSVLLVPLTSRLLTAPEPVGNRSLCFSIRLAWDFFVRASENTFQKVCLGRPGRQDGRVSPWRIDPPPSPSALSRSAPPRRVPPRPLRDAVRPYRLAPPEVCLGLGFD